MTLMQNYVSLPCLHHVVALAEYIRSPGNSFKKVTYIDLDTTFSAYLRARLILKQSTITMTETCNPLEDLQKSIKIYLPTEGNFESILNEVMDSMSESCLIIFDSVNSFYNLYYKKSTLSQDLVSAT